MRGFSIKTSHLSVSKKSTRSWTGMPFARKSKIFGLHSIPANTTPVPLKNRFISVFSLIMCFFAAPVSEKTKCGLKAAKNQNIGLSTVCGGRKICVRRQKNYLKNSGSFSRKIISFLSAASPSAKKAQDATSFPPASATNSRVALNDSPVLITSSTIRTRLPLSI